MLLTLFLALSPTLFWLIPAHMIPMHHPAYPQSSQFNNPPSSHQLAPPSSQFNYPLSSHQLAPPSSQFNYPPSSHQLAPPPSLHQTSRLLDLGRPFWSSEINNFDQTAFSPRLYGGLFCGMKSYHDNYYEDRRLQIASCYLPTTGLEGNTDNTFTFTKKPAYDSEYTAECPGHSFVTRLDTYYSNYHEDRIIVLGCNEKNHVKPGNCQWTGYKNQYDGNMEITCAAGQAIFGVNSRHSNYYEDRQFRFKCCDVVPK